jgi:hypothetical protein
MGTNISILIAMLVVFPFALLSITKTIYHFWFVVTGVRHDKQA